MGGDIVKLPDGYSLFAHRLKDLTSQLPGLVLRLSYVLH